MICFSKTLRRTFWFCFYCSLGGWWFVLGVDTRRQMVVETLAWLRRLTW